MNYEMIERVYTHLEDEESKKIFNARLQYVFDRDWYKFLPVLKKSKVRTCFDSFYQKRTEKIVIFGAGKAGRYALELLKMSGKGQYPIVAFCDNNAALVGKEIDGLRIMSFEELYFHKNEFIVVIGSGDFTEEIYEQLLQNDFPVSNIFYPPLRHIFGWQGEQYFDFFEPDEGEIFLDGGSYDGQTSVDFTKWTKNTYEKIYLFEALQDKELMCRQRLEENQINKYELIMKGLWDKSGTVSFNTSNRVSRGSEVSLDGKGNGVIPVTSIDEVLNGRCVTFIKMDIEGSETKALMGAKETIKKYRPRVAVCAYHKMKDFIELPLLLWDICPEYHIAFRHYSLDHTETVLYAWCNTK